MPKHERSTDELLNEIKQTHEIEKFIKNNSGEFTDKPLHEMLNEIIADRKLKKSEVIKGSGLNRVYAYQILSGKKMPSRDKLIAFCFGLQLDVDETNSLLKSAGLPVLYARNKRDSIIIYAINSGKSVFITNNLLFENKFDILTT
ncbi:MAG: helix-turn-helix domain-containing protein [Oscillospiraceae bacterium]|nr:helix-turn-helix domain-containing protein [Oscillospiraceae bacterium]